MNVVAPSRFRVPPSGRPAPHGRVESTCEEDLLEVFSKRSLDEDELHTPLASMTVVGPSWVSPSERPAPSRRLEIFSKRNLEDDELQTFLMPVETYAGAQLEPHGACFRSSPTPPMNVAAPSRASPSRRPAPSGRVEGPREEDSLEILSKRSLEEDGLHAFWTPIETRTGAQVEPRGACFQPFPPSRSVRPAPNRSVESTCEEDLLEIVSKRSLEADGFQTSLTSPSLMNAADPCSGRPAPSGDVERTREEDLLEIFSKPTLDVPAFQTWLIPPSPMDVAGSSRAPLPGRLAPSGRVESVYEEDLLEIFSKRSLEDDELHTFLTPVEMHAGARSMDCGVANDDLLQQMQMQFVFDQGRAVVEGIAPGEHIDPDFEQTPLQTPVTVPRPNENSTVTKRNGKQRAGSHAARNNTESSQTRRGWFSIVDWGSDSELESEPDLRSIPGTSVSDRPTGHDCVICQDPIHGAEIRAPCGHYYDIACVTDLFQAATKDETLYPPRCCRQNIPLARVQPHLSQAFISTFRSKQVEFSTFKRVYCSSPTCSRFLGPLSEDVSPGKVYACPAPGCRRRTCGRCREQHSNDWAHICRPDADASEVLALSRESGWARCPGCSQMIELYIGCFHMTCRCRTEFCYLCLARWKTCRCRQWDEDRLLAVAEERVDAQLGVARGAQREAPEQPARPAPAPVPARPHRPHAPFNIALENRARMIVPAARPPVPARQIPLALERPRVVQFTPLQPGPARTQTSSAATIRHAPKSWAEVARFPNVKPANVASTSTVPAGTRTNRVAIASTSMSASASDPDPEPPSTSSSGQTRWYTDNHEFVPDSDDVSVRLRMVREMMDRLRLDHDCDHERWYFRNGDGHCQGCGRYLPLYLFRCGGCEMSACNRCRRNRL